MSIYIALTLSSYFLVSLVTYLYLKKLKYFISYHFGMNIAMISSGVMGIAIGTILGYAFPSYYAVITILTTIVAILIGAIFGALVDYQTMLSGISGGIMTGIMGPMIGVVADFSLIIFCTILVYIMFGLICFSIRS